MKRHGDIWTAEPRGLVTHAPGCASGRQEREHTHKCSDCQTIWKHGEACRNNDAAHQCPQCGREQFWVHEFLR